MTEKEIYNLQNDIYWWLQRKMQDIPPMLQKIIMEGIYSRYQTMAEQYQWELQIEELAKKKGADGKVHLGMPDYMQDNSDKEVPDYIKNSHGETQETQEGVCYQ